jgi:hypothetical protein
MNDKHELPSNLERDGEERALRRAQQEARETARRTGTPLVIYHNGKIEKRLPDEAPESAGEEAASGGTADS